MQQETFLPQGLEIGRTGIGGGFEERLMKLAERFRLEEYFVLPDVKSKASLDARVHEFRLRLDSLEAPPHLESRRKRVLAKNAQKPMEAVAVVHASGIVANPNRAHMHDICGGSGLVGIAANVLRGDPEKTSVDCWELNLMRKQVFDEIKTLVLPSRAPLQFREADIHNVLLPRAGSRAMYWSSKHACGELATVVLGKLRDLLRANPEESPDGLCINTCCHGRLKNYPPSWLPETGMDKREWTGLCMSADWVNAKDPYKQIVARASMRVLDTLRVRYSGLSGIRVTEVLPATRSAKNQAFVFEVGKRPEVIS